MVNIGGGSVQSGAALMSASLEVPRGNPSRSCRSHSAPVAISPVGRVAAQLKRWASHIEHLRPNDMLRITDTLCRLIISKIGGEVSTASLADRCPLQGKRFPPTLVSCLRQPSPKPPDAPNATFAGCSVKASPAVLPVACIVALFTRRGPRYTHLSCGDVRCLLRHPH